MRLYDIPEVGLVQVPGNEIVVRLYANLPGRRPREIVRQEVDKALGPGWAHDAEQDQNPYRLVYKRSEPMSENSEPTLKNTTNKVTAEALVLARGLLLQLQQPFTAADTIKLAELILKRHDETAHKPRELTYDEWAKRESAQVYAERLAACERKYEDEG